MDGEQILKLIGVAVVVAAFVCIGVWYVTRTRKRRAGLQQWAQRHAGTYTASDNALTKQWNLPPLYGIGGATNIVRAILDGNQFTGFTHSAARGGGSPTSRVVGVLDIGTPLPTVVVGSPSVTIRDPHPPHPLDLDEATSDWPAYTTDAPTAAAVRRLLTSEFRRRLAQEAATMTRVELAFDGQQIIVASFGHIDAAKLDQRATLLTDLARLLPTG